MATVDETAQLQERASRKHRPFAWMSRKLASLRTSNGRASSTKKTRQTLPSKLENDAGLKNGKPSPRRAGHGSGARTAPYTNGAERHTTGSHDSLGAHEGAQDPDAGGSNNNSAAPTLATNPDTVHSDAGKSRAETANTGGPAVSTVSGGGNSIFSSSNHSARSLTTTLTTIQSTATPGAMGQTAGNSNISSATPGHTAHPSQSSTYFSHQYPTTPASAVPPHMNQGANSGFVPASYRSATANNLLSDNASILTLASSSQMNQRRRNSLDTNASVRAIAPSSQWGGSRESLPLSVLSQSAEAPQSSSTAPAHQQQRPSVGAIAPAERASVYSSSGVNAPALSSERNSVYAGRIGTKDTTDTSSMKGQEDARSTRSGMLGSHGRNDSVGGSVVTSPLATPRDAQAPSDV